MRINFLNKTEIPEIKIKPYHKASYEKAGETYGCYRSNLQLEPLVSQQNKFKENCCFVVSFVFKVQNPKTSST